MMRVYCGRLSPTNSVIECLLLEQSPNRLQLAGCGLFTNGRSSTVAAILSAFVDGDVGVGDVLRRQALVAIPVIVLGEFRYGIAKSRHRTAYEAWLESRLPHFDVLAVTDETATAYATLRVALR